MMKVLLFASLGLLALTACGDDGDSKGAADGGDGVSDVVADVGADVTADAGTDTAADTVLEDTGADLLEPDDGTGEDGLVADTGVDGQDTAPDQSETTSGVVIPDTPAGVQLAWLLSVFAHGTVTKEAVVEHFSDSVLKGMNPIAYASQVKQSIALTGALELIGFEDQLTTDHAITARVRSIGNDTWWYLQLQTEATAPHTITYWSLMYGPMLDPALGGPVGPQEIGMFAFDPYKGGIVPGVSVELLDRATGESFDPPVVGTTVETYGWVRLTLPPGVDEVGVRATAADGFVTRSYSAVLTAGASGVAVPAFPAAALADYLGGMGIEPAPGAGHLWGFVEWSSGADPLAPKDLLVDPYVGCATVAMEPAGPQLYYSSPKTGWPDVTAEHTHPDYATWWAYNVPAAPLKLTADAGGKILVVDIPAIEPGGITLVNMLYAPPECAAHPEPAGCSEQE